MNIKQKTKDMSLEEKIGQKIMLDFRYWNLDNETEEDMTEPDDTIAQVIKDNHIGGVILFSNNLKNKKQIKTLTAWYAKMRTHAGVQLFIGTDNEGGSVFRLPRGDYISFPGNMALSAAIEGGADEELAVEQAKAMAKDMLDLNINTNFSPVVDVNTNPFNPVINVRAFSDGVNIVSRLAEKFTSGMKYQGLITAYKHFPGHGSTSSDSHTGLPRVDRSREDAFAIDMAPYKLAIDKQVAPDMVMTAHIQYPALDNSQVTTRSGEKITVPATMSHEIQTQILRNELGYTGVTISDALDMGAIAEHFNEDAAIENVFTAGVDIALMPISISSPSQTHLIRNLIQKIVALVKEGRISESDINISVERILDLKARNNLLDQEKRNLNTKSSNIIPAHELEKQISDGSVTVVINRRNLLPFKDKNLKYFILTPWNEQAKGIASVLSKEGFRNVVCAGEKEMNDTQIRAHIAECDIFILGTLSTHFTPIEKSANTKEKINHSNDEDPYSNWLKFASELGKKRVHASFRAPYDIVNYAENVDTSVATYSYYGYDNGTWRGHSMISLAEIMTGKISPQGKLPTNIWHDYNPETNTGTIAFPRGFGITW